jgi:hypothetical protein
MAAAENIIHPAFRPLPVRERIRRAFKQILWPAVALGGLAAATYGSKEFEAIGTAIFFGAVIWIWARGLKKGPSKPDTIE